jgi:hypothetical protein
MQCTVCATEQPGSAAEFSSNSWTLGDTTVRSCPACAPQHGHLLRVQCHSHEYRCNRCFYSHLPSALAGIRARKLRTAGNSVQNDLQSCLDPCNTSIQAWHSKCLKAAHLLNRTTAQTNGHWTHTKARVTPHSIRHKHSTYGGLLHCDNPQVVAGDCCLQTDADDTGCQHHTTTTLDFSFLRAGRGIQEKIAGCKSHRRCHPSQRSTPAWVALLPNK